MALIFSCLQNELWVACFIISENLHKLIRGDEKINKNLNIECVISIASAAVSLK